MRRVVIAVLVALFPAALGAQAAAPPPQVLIKAGRLIDGRANQVQANVGMLTEGARIKAVGPLAQV